MPNPPAAAHADRDGSAFSHVSEERGRRVLSAPPDAGASPRVRAERDVLQVGIVVDDDDSEEVWPRCVAATVVPGRRGAGDTRGNARDASAGCVGCGPFSPPGTAGSDTGGVEGLGVPAEGVGLVVGGVEGGVSGPQGVEESGRVTYPAGGAPSGPWASGRFAATSMRCCVQPSPVRKSTHDTPMSMTVAVGSISHQRWSADCMNAMVALAGLVVNGIHTAVESVCDDAAAWATPPNVHRSPVRPRAARSAFTVAQNVCAALSSTGVAAPATPVETKPVVTAEIEIRAATTGGMEKVVHTACSPEDRRK